jgi:hypothetical protein
MTQLHLNIKQQIKLLPLDESLRTRILELTIFSKIYDVENDYSQFNIMYAFSWNDSREGHDFWFDIMNKIHSYEILQ